MTRVTFMCGMRGSLRYRSLSNISYRRQHSKARIVDIPKANVYRFGDTNIAMPVFQDVQWTVKDGECWAVVGSGSGEKTTLLQTLLGHLRISPPPPDGLFPFLFSPSSESPRDPHIAVSLVSFAHRPRSSGGAFYDYSARYGAVWDDDRITLRQSMFPELVSETFPDVAKTTTQDQPINREKQEVFDRLVEKLSLKHLLDLPLVTLSNGQTRRARIVKVLLSRPDLLLLDEPLTGLDVNNRPTLLSLLHSLHITCNPRIILALRSQDPIPEWITHVALVHQGRVTTGTKEEMLASDIAAQTIRKESGDINVSVPRVKEGEVLVSMNNVNVSYGGRQILKNIQWTIREGERWHLQGENGSGKTTLLSLLTGDHPQSYTQLPPSSHLTLFGCPRSCIPTPRLRSLIGVVSPELYNAFPRRAGMTVWEAIGTGFDGGFVPYGKKGVGVGLNGQLSDDEIIWRVNRVWQVIKGLLSGTWSSEIHSHKNDADDSSKTAAEIFAERTFVDLSGGEQSMVLLMRALVGRPQLVFLDEVWSGMDDAMVQSARDYLRREIGEDQAIVVISHWEEEVPWTKMDGLRLFRLTAGEGGEV